MQRQLLGEVGADQDARRLIALLLRDGVDRPFDHRLREVRDLAFELRIDALDADELRPLLVRDEALALNRRRRADNARHGAQLGDLGGQIRQAGSLPDIDVGGSAENPVAQLALESGHQRQRDDRAR